MPPPRSVRRRDASENQGEKGRDWFSRGENTAHSLGSIGEEGMENNVVSPKKRNGERGVWAVEG